MKLPPVNVDFTWPQNGGIFELRREDKGKLLVDSARVKKRWPVGSNCPQTVPQFDNSYSPKKHGSPLLTCELVDFGSCKGTMSDTIRFITGAALQVQASSHPFFPGPSTTSLVIFGG